MDRRRKVIGFVGIDKYEYILYIARVLYHLGKKPLMVDSSETGALASSVPNPFMLEGTIIDYRGVGFADCRLLGNEQQIFINPNDLSEYEVELIDFGFITNPPGLRECNHLVCVTDQLVHNIVRIKEIRSDISIAKTLVIKDMVLGKVNQKYIFDEIKENVCDIEAVYVGYHDEIDSACRIHSQHENKFDFHKLSRQSKSIVEGLVTVIYPTIDKKALEVAYKKAEKGE